MSCPFNVGGGPKVPCRGCQKREVGCHSSCAAYLGYKAEMEKYKAWEKEHTPPPKSAYLKKWIRQEQRKR